MVAHSCDNVRVNEEGKIEVLHHTGWVLLKELVEFVPPHYKAKADIVSDPVRCKCVAGTDKPIIPDSGILQSKFVCPEGHDLEDCTIECPHYELCENWKEIMFKVVEETVGSLVRGLFLR